MYAEVLRDGRGAVVAPEDAPDAEEVAARIRDDRSAVVLALELDGEIVGEGAVTTFGPRWLRHVGVLALHVAPRHQGRGLGRALVRGLLARARAMGLERVELAVRADNDRAIALYRAEGFVTEGVRRAFVRPRGAPAVDDLLMARFFHPPRREEVFAVVVRPGATLQDRLVAVRSAPLGAGQRPREVARASVADRAGGDGPSVPSWDEPLRETEPSGLPALVRRHAAVFAAAADADDADDADPPDPDLVGRLPAELAARLDRLRP